jgi:hypothetical protein
MSSGGATSKSCIDFVGSSWVAGTEEASCASTVATVSKTYSSGHCGSAGSSGACEMPSGAFQYTQYYYDLSAEVAAAFKSGCTVAGGAWFNP